MKVWRKPGLGSYGFEFRCIIENFQTMEVQENSVENGDIRVVCGVSLGVAERFRRRIWTGGTYFLLYS